MYCFPSGARNQVVTVKHAKLRLAADQTVVNLPLLVPDDGNARKWIGGSWRQENDLGDLYVIDLVVALC
jgi:hypothetical protein